jgi:hypothetical protein
MPFLHAVRRSPLPRRLYAIPSPYAALHTVLVSVNHVTIGPASIQFWGTGMLLLQLLLFFWQLSYPSSASQIY